MNSEVRDMLDRIGFEQVPWADAVRLCLNAQMMLTGKELYGKNRTAAKDAALMRLRELKAAICEYLDQTSICIANEIAIPRVTLEVSEPKDA